MILQFVFIIMNLNLQKKSLIVVVNDARKPELYTQRLQNSGNLLLKFFCSILRVQETLRKNIVQ